MLLRNKASFVIFDPLRQIELHPDNPVNTISTKTFWNNFSGRHYYDIIVDGITLDQIILNHYKEHNPGLVTTLLNWLDYASEDGYERKLVWDRLHLKCGKIEYLPILMCSEDIDLSCETVIVEMECDENFVYWHRIGYATGERTIEEIHKDIKWMDRIKSMKFKMNEFKEVIDEFRKYLNNKSKLAYPPSWIIHGIGNAICYYMVAYVIL